MTQVPVRVGADSDLVALRDLEREASLVGLAHVFPSYKYPYPDNDVLARWALVLADPDCTTLVVDRAEVPGALDAFVAFDPSSVRHLAVRPALWGSGLARQLLAEACARIDGPVRLWVLAENHRARRLYEHLGWAPTGVEQTSAFPPFPVELEYERPAG